MSNEQAAPRFRKSDLVDYLGLTDKHIENWQANKRLPRMIEAFDDGARVGLPFAMKAMALLYATTIGIGPRRLDAWWRELGLENRDFGDRPGCRLFLIISSVEATTGEGSTCAEVRLTWGKVAENGDNQIKTKGDSPIAFAVIDLTTIRERAFEAYAELETMRVRAN